MISSSISLADLAEYTDNQLHFFSLSHEKKCDLLPYMDKTMKRVDNSFTSIHGKYYSDGKKSVFNYLHGDHYCAFLYIISNEAYKDGNEILAQKIFLLNKALHGLDLFYGITLPEIFLLVHPVGTVLGNAKYGNHFVTYQNCSVGSLEDGKYPTFEGETILFAKTTVLGNCHVGRNVAFAANSFILNVDIPDNSTVVGCYPNHRILPIKENVMDRFFVRKTL